MRAMDCTDIKALLSGLIDDRLDAETRHSAERHLAECETCRALIDEAEAIDALVLAEANIVNDAASAEAFEAAVLSRTVHADARRPGRWTSLAGWIAAAAALALAGSIWVMDRRPEIPAATTVQANSSGGAVSDDDRHHDPYSDNSYLRSRVRQPSAQPVSLQRDESDLDAPEYEGFNS